VALFILDHPDDDLDGRRIYFATLDQDLFRQGIVQGGRLRHLLRFGPCPPPVPPRAGR